MEKMMVNEGYEIDSNDVYSETSGGGISSNVILGIVIGICAIAGIVLGIILGRRAARK